MSTYNIGFYEDLTKIIFQLSNIIKYAPYLFTGIPWEHLCKRITPSFHLKYTILEPLTKHAPISAHKVLVAPLAQLVECRTLDCKVPGLILTRGAVLCP